MHKAGIPSYGKYRDMLLCFIWWQPSEKKIDDIFHYEKDYYDCIWQCKNDLPKNFLNQKILEKPLIYINHYQNN